MIGSKLAHYEVTGRLGAGGMGEVFRALDTRLGRSVAIKVLPEAFARDASRLDRFEREARALAALNHPHIAAIYGIEEHDGRRFLVLELVEGATLAERLAHGPIAVDEAVKFALQIAEALEAAHEKGIVHRDLKPANIKINPEGNIKVLDFGLAKALAEDGANVNSSNSPTLSMQATGQGIILGTAAYMAPEQARGLTVDKRADIWSFGCVLYEMLTGRQTFQGQMVSDILASVLVRDPDYSALQANLHPKIKDLLRRCLEKDPKNRWQAAGDVRVELEHVVANPLEMLVQSTASVPPQPASRWKTSLVIAGFVLVAGLSGLAAWIFKPANPLPVTRFSQVLPEGEQFTGTGRPVLAVSPDGLNIAYVANFQIYLRAINEFEARVVPGTNEAPSPNTPFFSPDGQWIGYWSSSSQLKKISIRGGAPVILCSAASPLGVSWGSDGTILFGQANGIMRVSENGGNPDLIIPTKPGELAYGPELLPDGDTILFSLSAGVSTARWDEAQIVVHSLRSGERKVLIGGSDARYVPTGHLIYALGNSLFAAPFDLDDLQLTGGPVPIASGVRRADTGNTAAANYSVSGNGLFAYVVGVAGGVSGSLAWVDRTGRAEPIQNLPQRRAYNGPRLSPDGRRIAVAESGDVWIYERDRGSSIRLTRDGSSIRPTWDPKGLQIAYTSSSSGTENVFVRPSDGSGEARQLTKAKTVQDHLDSWSPDGRMLLFHRHEGTPSDMLMLLLSDGDPTEKVFLKQPSADEGGKLSPDGNWIAYYSDESGRPEIYITPYPGPGGKFPVSTGGGTMPVWARNGELFYRSTDLRSLMAVKVSTKPALSIGKPELLFEGAYQIGGAGGSHPNYDVTADGQRFLMVLPDVQPGSSGTPRPQINVVENWFEELRQRVPVC